MKKSTPWLLMLLMAGVFAIGYYEQRTELVAAKKDLVKAEQRRFELFREMQTELEQVIDEAARAQKALDKCRRVR